MKFYNKNPKIGDKRIVSKFAFFPTRITDELTVWLCFYRRVEMYRNLSSIGRPNCWIKINDTLQSKEDWEICNDVTNENY